MLRIQLLFCKIALFVRIELLCRFICGLPSNRANGVAAFEVVLFGTTMLNLSLEDTQKLY